MTDDRIREIRQAVNDALFDTKGNFGATEQAVLKWINSFQGQARKELSNSCEAYCVHELVEERKRNLRDVQWDTVDGQVVITRNKITHGNGTLQSQESLKVNKDWGDYIMRSGKLLREATRPELIAESEYWFGHMRNAGHHARWFKMIAERMPDDKKTVEQVFGKRTAKELEAIHSSAKK